MQIFPKALEVQPDIKRTYWGCELNTCLVEALIDLLSKFPQDATLVGEIGIDFWPALKRCDGGILDRCRHGREALTRGNSNRILKPFERIWKGERTESPASCAAPLGETTADDAAFWIERSDGLML